MQSVKVKGDTTRLSKPSNGLFGYESRITIKSKIGTNLTFSPSHTGHGQSCGRTASVWMVVSVEVVHVHLLRLCICSKGRRARLHCTPLFPDATRPKQKCGFLHVCTIQLHILASSAKCLGDEATTLIISSDPLRARNGAVIGKQV